MDHIEYIKSLYANPNSKDKKYSNFILKELIKSGDIKMFYNFIVSKFHICNFRFRKSNKLGIII